MFDDRSRKYGNQYVPLKPVDIDLYEPYIGKEALDWIKFLAKPLEKKGVGERELDIYRRRRGRDAPEPGSFRQRPGH